MSDEVSLLFVPYNGDLGCMSVSCLEFIMRYFIRQVTKNVGFVDRRVHWLERERGDCVVAEKDVVENTWVVRVLLNPSIIIVSGRVRSTRSSSATKEVRYKLHYRLSYDSRHVFSEKEKEEMARRMKEKGAEECISGQSADEVVISVRVRRVSEC